MVVQLQQYSIQFYWTLNSIPSIHYYPTVLLGMYPRRGREQQQVLVVQGQQQYRQDSIQDTSELSRGTGPLQKPPYLLTIGYYYRDRYHSIGIRIGRLKTISSRLQYYSPIPTSNYLPFPLYTILPVLLYGYPIYPRLQYYYTILTSNPLYIPLQYWYLVGIEEYTQEPGGDSIVPSSSSIQYIGELGYSIYIYL